MQLPAPRRRCSAVYEPCPQLEAGAGARPAALEVYGGELLWADSEAQQLRACDKERCAARTQRTLRAAAPGVLALRVYDAAVQRAVRGPCAARAAPCAHVCVAVSATASQCRCATGYRRHGDACTRKCSILHS